jgi:hypothetical protein
VPAWVIIPALLASFMVGVGVGVLLTWEDRSWRRHESRRGGFVDPGLSRERLGLDDERRERRSGRPRVRPIAADAIEGPPDFRVVD